MRVTLVLENGDLCAEAVRTWRAAGHRVVVARHSFAPAREGDDWTLNLTDDAALAGLLSVLSGADSIDLVHALAAAPPLAGLAGIEAAQRTVLWPLMQLARSLGGSWLRSGRDCSLHVLTVGVAGSGAAADERTLVGGPLTAMTLAFRYEYPALRVLVTDLPAADPALAARALNRRDDGGWRALRQGGYLRPVLADVPVADRSAAGYGTGGVHVVTGGLGGVSRHVVDALRGAGDMPMALLQRREPTATDRSLLRHWSHAGPVRAYQADVTDPAVLGQALDAVRRELGPIGVVIHAAGVVEDGFARVKSVASLERVLAPKVRGAWLLDELTSADPVTAFVLFSSTVALYGGAGQADYAAANAFLDAFARYRAARRPGLSQSLDWSAWHETGMTSGLPADAGALRTEVIPLEPAQGAAALLAAAGSRANQLVIEHRRDPATARELLGPARPRPVPSQPAPSADGRGSGSGRRPELAAPDTTDNTDTTSNADTAALNLVAVTASALGVDCRERADEDFFTLGLDSAGLLDLASRLAGTLGAEVYPTLLFEFPTPRTLAAHLAAEHGTALLAGHTAPQDFLQPAAPAASVGPEGAVVADGLAIVGYAYRFPGARTPAEFWANLVGGVTAGRPAELSRRLPAPPRDDPQSAALIDGITDFDPLFFKISATEAPLVDPQHRLVLEHCWKALEHAGHAGASARRQRTGVFLGVMNAEYETEALRAGIDLGVATRTSRAVLSNAVSYALNLNGPCLTVETACSSSLTAIHLAERALCAGDADMVLAGGVNVVVSPTTTAAYARAGLLSPTGRCRPFDQAANGYVRGEGVGIVVLRRLADARASGDTVYGVLRGSAVGHSGSGNGLGAPNPAAQAAVVREALGRSGLRPADISYVETHGTGTVLGDSVEIEGLVQALGGEGGTCYLSSAKGNIGHLEPASGVASLIKVLHSFEHAVIAPIAGLGTPAPLLKLAGQRLALTSRPQPWPRADSPRRAGISSFGFGGTNAHLIVEEPREPGGRDPDRAVELVLLSAKTAAALAALRAELAGYLAAGPGDSLADVARTLAAGREHFAVRSALVVGGTGELRAALAGAAPIRPSAGRIGGLSVELGPVRADAEVPELASRPEYRAEREAWRAVEQQAGDAGREAARMLAASCAVGRWLISVCGVPGTIRARGTGLLVAGVLAGTLTRQEAVSRLIGGHDERLGRGVAASREFLVDDQEQATWEDWLGRVTVGGQPEASAPAASAPAVHWPPAAAGATGWPDLLRQLAEAYEQGADAAWEHVASGRRVPLPGYPFERERYWCLDASRPEPDPVRLLVPRWSRLPRPAGEVPAAPETWLVYAADPAAAEPVLRTALAQDHHCVVVTPGNEYASAGAGHYRVRLTDRDDHQRLLDSLNFGDTRVRAWFLLALDSAPVPFPGAPETSAAAGLCAGLCALHAALRARLAGHRPDLTVMTKGAVTVAGAAASSPSGAALIALARVLTQEDPRLPFTVVDLDPADGRLPDPLPEAGTAPPDGSLVRAQRGGNWLTPSFVPLEATGPVALAYRRAGPAPSAWWVTGATGGLGLAIAEELARDGVPLVLTSRRGLLAGGDETRPARREHPDRARLRALESEAGEVLLAPGDVTEPRDVARIAETVRRRFGPGYGIVHAAGQPGRGRRAHLLQQADFERVLGAKLLGAQLLDRYTRGDAVAQFLAVSSWSALAGGWGMGDYAAANAALDAFALARNARGLPTTVLNLTAVSGVGMAAAAAVPLPEGLSLSAVRHPLRLALDAVVPQLIAVLDPGDDVGPRRADSRTQPSGLSEQVPHGAPGRSQEIPGPQDRFAEFWAMLAEAVGISSQKLDHGATLPDLGLDSSAQLSFLGTVEAAFGIDLPLEILAADVSAAQFAELAAARAAESVRSPEAR